MRSRNSIRFAAFSALLLFAFAGRSHGQNQIQWLDDIDQAKSLAARDGKLLLVHFWSERCGPCKNLDTFVFPRPDVARAVHQHCIPVKVNTEENRGLTASYQIDRIPQDVFMLPDGKVVAQQISPNKANHYIQLVNAVSERAATGNLPQGMNGLTAGRARVAGLQSRSDSVPVVSASDLGGVRGDAGFGRSAPSIQVTDRMEPKKDAANLNNEYTNSLGQPQVPSFAGREKRQSPETRTTQTNPFAMAGSPSQVPRQQTAMPGGVTPSRIEQSSWRSPATSPANVTSNPGLALPPAGSSFGGKPTTIENSALNSQARTNRQFADPSRFSSSPNPTKPTWAPELPKSPQSSFSNAHESLDHSSKRGTDLSIPPQVASSQSAQQRGEARGNTAQESQTQSNRGLANQGLTAPPTLPKQPTTPPSQPRAAQSPSIPPQQARSEAGIAQTPPAANGQTTPAVALEGYCPITLVEHKSWQKGNKEFGCIHRGKLYLFCCASHRDRFLQFPDRFAPMLSGYDPVIFAEEQRLVEGKREHGVFASGRVYMFANEETLKQFYASLDRYTDITFQAMGLSQAPARTAQGNQSGLRR